MECEVWSVKCEGMIPKRILKIALRECGNLRKNLVYLFCMVFFPILVTVFFTTMMSDGLPTKMPVGVVDNDNTSTSRAIVRKLDSFQASHVVEHYPNINEARKAIQRNKIYAFLYIPKGTTDGLLSARQPKISFYYSQTSLVAGALLYRDLKTVSMLGSAAVGQSTMRANGYTDGQIKTFLQPIVIDLHMIGNPWASYNYYLSTMIIPGILMLFMFLITAYSLGTEIKFGTAKDWMAMANNNILVAGFGKHRIRHFRLRTDALATHVVERLFAVGSARILDERSHLPHFRHAPFHRGSGAIVSAAPLLYDLSNLHLQRLYVCRCVVQHHGTADFHGVAVLCRQ